MKIIHLIVVRASIIILHLPLNQAGQGLGSLQTLRPACADDS